MIDEFPKECLAMLVSRRITSQGVIDQLFQIFVLRDYGNGLPRQESKPSLLNGVAPWENGYIESFNGKMRDELLNRQILTTLEEAKVRID